MSEQQACKYWKGKWENNTCKIPGGSGKSRFELYWIPENKKFACYNIVERYEKGMIGEKNKDMVDPYREDIKNNPWAWTNAQWDPVILECGSQSERDCRDADKGWNFKTGKCYEPAKNKNMCESMGAKWTVLSDGTQKCDCVVKDREFHWVALNMSAEYTIHQTETTSKIKTVGSISGTQYATVESCIDDLLQTDFFANKKVHKLECQ